MNLKLGKPVGVPNIGATSPYRMKLCTSALFNGIGGLCTFAGIPGEIPIVRTT
jgi:hypothetical protein